MWLTLAAALVAMMTIGHIAPCRAAGLVIEAPNLTATPGSTGSFDLLLANTNPAGGTSYDVAADSFGLALAGPLSVTFTGVSINTVAAPYIYVTSGTTQGAGPLSTDAFPNTQFTGSDSEFAAPGFRTVNPGDVFGLAHVSYMVSPITASGRDSIVISSGAATSLSDINGLAIPFTISNGSITVAVVPEPPSLVLGLVATTVLLGVGWLRHRWTLTLKIRIADGTAPRGKWGSDSSGEKDNELGSKPRFPRVFPSRNPSPQS
jgi:hypothetical protein